MQPGDPAMHRVGAWIEGGYSERHRYIKVEGNGDGTRFQEKADLPVAVGVVYIQ
jgi:hypothetical protein